MDSTEIEILKNYNDLKVQLTQWGAHVDKTIGELLNNANPKITIKIEPQYRLKENHSFVSKALYRKKGYSNPMLDIEDKVGTRVVLLTSDEIKSCAEILQGSTEWQIKVTKDIESIISDAPKVFDYLSTHLVVWPNETDNRFNEESIPLLTCEIQIRTLLQHAFAEVSHDSVYKGPYLNDNVIIRHLAKSMALMEATDDYFCIIFKMMQDDTMRYKSYTNQLTEIYQELNNDYNKRDLDISLTDIFFEALPIDDVSIDDIRKLIDANRVNYQNIIDKKKEAAQIFKQPIILLIAYYLATRREYLKEYWPISTNSMKSVFTAFNYSLDV